MSRKTKLIRLVIVVFLVGLAAAGISLLLNANRISTDDAYVDGRIHTVASKVSGTVNKVYVEDNQRVDAGALLVEIDPVDYQARAGEAHAALSAEEAKLDDARLSIKTAAAAFDMQKATQTQALSDFKRAQALYKEGAVTKEKFEKAQTALAFANAQAKAAKEAVNRSRANAKLEESLVAQKRATLKIAQLNLDYTKICASVNGYVTKKAVETGNQIQAGQPLLALVSLDDVWIVANYKETQLKKVKLGQKVVIKVDMFPGKTFTGRVESIMAGTGAAFSLFPPENALGNFVKVVQRVPVKIVLDKNSDSGHLLRLGMSVIPSIIVGNE